MTGEIERIAAGDHTQAEALRIARDRLEKMGWKYTAADIGKTAAEILNGLRTHLQEQSR